jgi:hypothetical protein
MKSIRFAALLGVLASAAFAQTTSQATFAKLKTLEGSWAGKTSEGKAVQTAYRVTSNGSALMGEIHSDEDMISMIHMDNDRLLMTHYCGVGNQPRMSASASPDGNTITFHYIDATNLLNAPIGHMQQMTLHFIDADHYTETWEFAAKDGSKMQEFFDLHRTK